MISKIHEIFNKFEIPELGNIDVEQNLVYKTNEYIGYYRKEIYYDLKSKDIEIHHNGTLKLTFTSSVKEFNIKKAMHLIKTDEIHSISLTFMLYNKGNNWDTERYNYTLWKDKK